MAEPETGIEEPGTETDPDPEPKPEPANDRLPDDHPAAVALRKANKEAEELRRKVKEFEDADKTELEKATTAAEEARKRAEAAEANALRLEIASEKGLTPSQAKRLVGTTREELEADADELLETFGKPDDGKPKLPTRPKPSGGKGDKKPEQLEGKERAAAALREMRGTH